MSDSESEDLIFGVSEDLVPPAVIKSAGISEVDFNGLLSPPLRLQEDLANGCGGQLWYVDRGASPFSVKQQSSKTSSQECLIYLAKKKLYWSRSIEDTH